jgi:FMN phosphatase YigB (HAD superfamily)
MGIKAVALDIYGTVLDIEDYDYSRPPRKGLADFLDKCDQRGIRVVTSSDAPTGTVRNDLLVAFRLVIGKIANAGERAVMKKRLNLERFDNFFQLDQGIKDFSIIIGHYDILPRELLVIGDNPNKDIIGALRLGAFAIQCPPYSGEQGADWDFSKIDLDSIDAKPEIGF